MGIHGESGAQRLKLLPSRQATDLAFGQLFRGTRALDIKRDDNILLFERDILLMFTNALSMYNREFDIHQHAQYMINYAMELLTVR